MSDIFEMQRTLDRYRNALRGIDMYARAGVSTRNVYPKEVVLQRQMNQIAAIVRGVLATETAPNATKTSAGNGENCNEKRNRTEEFDGMGG